MEYAIRPSNSELKQARRIIDGVIAACKVVMTKENDLEISLGWSDEEYVKHEMKGISGYTYSPELIAIEFNTNVKGWQNSLKTVTAREYAHSVFAESVPVSEIDFYWQYTVFEAQASVFAEKIVESPLEKEKSFTKEELKDYWPNYREKISEEVDEDRSLFFGTEEFPKWLGYAISYHIGKKLMEDRTLKEFSKVSKSEVLSIGDELF